MGYLRFVSNPFFAVIAFLSLAGIFTGCSKITGSGAAVEVRASLLSVAVTEINYHPLANDLIDGDEYEFVEIKNIGSADIDLSDVAFTDGIHFAFSAGTVLQPGSFIVLASNSTEFSSRYGFAPFGVYTGKLSNSGEEISIKDLLADKKFLSITYKANGAWPASADGGGYSLVPRTSNMVTDPNVAAFWRASFNKNGSPGRVDPDVVYINEVLTHTDLPQVDAVEIFNPNGAPVDIGNWFLTDGKFNPKKYQIPAGTVVPALGYLVIDESKFNADSAASTSFRFSENGEEVYLFSDSTGVRSGSYYHGFSFGVIENGVSFGRQVTSTGQEDFVAQKSVTLGVANAGPLVGPLVISEIMYNPQNGRDEFVEITNTSGAAVALYDAAFPANTWKITAIDFAFPPNTTIASGEAVLVVSNAITADEFRSLYNVNQSVRIFSKTGDLSNAGDTVMLLKPEDPYIDSSLVLPATVVPYMVRDFVAYSDAGDWPKGADGSGMSLQRTNLDEYGNDPENWKAATPTPGK